MPTGEQESKYTQSLHYMEMLMNTHCTGAQDVCTCTTGLYVVAFHVHV